MDDKERVGLLRDVLGRVKKDCSRKQVIAIDDLVETRRCPDRMAKKDWCFWCRVRVVLEETASVS